MYAMLSIFFSIFYIIHHFCRQVDVLAFSLECCILGFVQLKPMGFGNWFQWEQGPDLKHMYPSGNVLWTAVPCSMVPCVMISWKGSSEAKRTLMNRQNSLAWTQQRVSRDAPLPRQPDNSAWHDKWVIQICPFWTYFGYQKEKRVVIQEVLGI